MADTPKTVIFSAPPGWGKTATAAGLQIEFGCSAVVDEWNTRQGITKGALHLTNQPPHELAAAARQVIVISRGWSQQRQRGAVLPTVTAWLAGITCAFAIAAIGCNLDGIDDHHAEWQQAQDLQLAINAATARGRFEHAAQQLCGPQAAWAELADGSVQCRTKYGRPTITVRVSP